MLPQRTELRCSDCSYKICLQLLKIRLHEHVPVCGGPSLAAFFILLFWKNGTFHREYFQTSRKTGFSSWYCKNFHLFSSGSPSRVQWNSLHDSTIQSRKCFLLQPNIFLSGASLTWTSQKLEITQHWPFETPELVGPNTTHSQHHLNINLNSVLHGGHTVHVRSQPKLSARIPLTFSTTSISTYTRLFTPTTLYMHDLNQTHQSEHCSHSAPPQYQLTLRCSRWPNWTCPSSTAHRFKCTAWKKLPIRWWHERPCLRSRGNISSWSEWSGFQFLVLNKKATDYGTEKPLRNVIGNYSTIYSIAFQYTGCA